MNSKIKNALIGLFVIVAIVAVVMIILFLNPSIGDGGKTLKARFTNISGINVGTRVTLAGRAVGEVTAIQPIKQGTDDRVDALGRVYFYQLTLKVDSSVVIYSVDEVSIQTTGLMGEKSIAITPKAPKKGQKRKNITTQIIYGNAIDPLENALHQISNLSVSIEAAVNDFDQWFTENSDDLSSAINAFAGAMKEIDVSLATINKTEVILSLKDSLDIFTDNMQLVHNMLDEMDEKQMVSKANVIFNNFVETSEALNIDGKRILHNVNIITQDIADGKGTIGKLFHNDDIYLQISAILTKANTLMNDINHYGVLFQYDKHWQRSRTKRANILSALKSPQEFKSYFQSEVDDITTSLARISMLLEKAKTQKEKDKIIQSPNFKKDFVNLMHQIDEMSNAIKLYNEQLIDMQSDQ
jgi:phospholipid/cholesterol/gamma-HCH transport system substrate-binding protein